MEPIVGPCSSRLPSGFHRAERQLANCDRASATTRSAPLDITKYRRTLGLARLTHSHAAYIAATRSSSPASRYGAYSNRISATLAVTWLSIDRSLTSGDADSAASRMDERCAPIHARNSCASSAEAKTNAGARPILPLSGRGKPPRSIAAGRRAIVDVIARSRIADPPLGPPAREAWPHEIGNAVG